MSIANECCVDLCMYMRIRKDEVKDDSVFEELKREEKYEHISNNSTFQYRTNNKVRIT